MKLPNAFCCWIGTTLVSCVVLCTTPSANAQRLLFHGGDADATSGDDAAVLAHLESLLGAGNVTYMQGAMAAPDGSSAAGFDAVLISSTLDSGTVRGKYDDALVGVMNWENALTRNADGEFRLAEGGATRASQTEIEIIDSTHPIANGLSGTVAVLSAPHTMSVGTGDVGPGVSDIATLVGTPTDHAIMAAEIGDELRGGVLAPGRRVMFFLENAGFADLTPEGLQLFDNAIDYITNLPFVPGDFNDDGMITEADFLILSNNLGGHLDGPVTHSEGDINRDGRVDLADFGEFKEKFPGAFARAHAIPEPATLALVATMLTAVLSLRAVRKQARR